MICLLPFQNLLVTPFHDQSQNNESQFLAETYEDLLSTAIINKVRNQSITFFFGAEEKNSAKLILCNRFSHQMTHFILYYIMNNHVQISLRIFFSYYYFS